MKRKKKSTEELKYEKERDKDQWTLALEQINSKIDLLVDGQNRLLEKLEREVEA
jgi:hypothetical protein